MTPVTFSDFFGDAGKTRLINLLELALAEDGPDLTSNGIFSPSDRMQATITAKQDTLIAGLPIIPLVLELCAQHPSELGYSWHATAEEGRTVPKGQVIARLSGSARTLLRAERVILNIMSRMCGVANLTSLFVKQLEGTGVCLLDTRKTMPGMRLLDKYAVRLGGALNHRLNLGDMLMLKDNHIDAAGSIVKAVDALRRAYSPCPPIEVECRTMEEVREAVGCQVERVMLDNMDAGMLAQALAIIPLHIEAEISGNVTLENIRELALTGPRQANFISVGRITHSAVAADLSMRFSAGPDQQ